MVRLRYYRYSTGSPPPHDVFAGKFTLLCYSLAVTDCQSVAACYTKLNEIALKMMSCITSPMYASRSSGQIQVSVINDAAERC